MGELFVVSSAAGELSTGDGGQSRAAISKWSAQGELLWLRRWGSGSQDEPYAIARDAMGSLYVAGRTFGALAAPNAGEQDVFLSKLDANGTVLWSAQWGTADDETPTAVALDASGNVYTVGDTYGMLASGGGGARDAFLTKHSSAGQLLWTRQWGGSGDDAARGVAIAVDGSLYVSGYGTQLAGTGSVGAFLSRWTLEGQRSWLEQWGDSSSVAYALYLDAHQQLYSVGWTAGAFDGTSQVGAIDAMVSRWTVSASTHMRTWSRQLGTFGDDFAYAVGTDADGTVYVAGRTSGAFPGFASRGGVDSFVLRITP